MVERSVRRGMVKVRERSWPWIWVWSGGGCREGRRVKVRGQKGILEIKNKK